ncbi:MAG: hypothetical protein AAGK05_15085, partial [Pseudomonadota bacterium]
MKKMLHTVLAVSISLALTGQVAAEQANDDKWQVDAPKGQFLDAKISVEQGTWMNVDISPDGKTVVFDLLGDIYTMPMSGGTATQLTSD